MKEFMMIFLSKDYGELGLSPEDIQEKMGKWWAWQSKMSEAEVLVGGHALTYEVKHIAGSDRTVSDLNTAELKEIVGGYYIVKADSFESAAKIAEGYPDYDLGGKVELREIMVFDR
ncbi:MAG: YciI family protein [Bacteroidia bacterium]